MNSEMFQSLFHVSVPPDGTLTVQQITFFAEGNYASTPVRNQKAHHHHRTFTANAMTTRKRKAYAQHSLFPVLFTLPVFQLNAAQ